MIIKLCGIKHANNLRSLSRIQIDWFGFNFYSQSKRCVRNGIESVSLINTPVRQKTVGIFVNSPFDFIKSKMHQYKLDYIQLHGDESVEYCQSLRNLAPIIKVFRIDSKFDFNMTEEFGIADYYLFDRKVKEFGGSGKKFKWKILDLYRGERPFLLSGGIGPEDVKEVINLNHPQFAGIDLNSRFEIKPGLKDVNVVSVFVEKIRKKYPLTKEGEYV